MELVYYLSYKTDFTANLSEMHWIPGPLRNVRKTTDMGL